MRHRFLTPRVGMPGFPWFGLPAALSSSGGGPLLRHCVRFSGPTKPAPACAYVRHVCQNFGGREYQEGQIEAHTISWLPATLVIEPVRLNPEVGKNLDLAASLAFAKSLDAQVSSWGPFAIKKELYDRALKQIDLLNSGKIAYIALDRRFRGQGASNCIHAVCDVDADKGFLDTGTAYGNEASQEAVSHLERWMVPTKEDLAYLNERLAIPKEVEHMAPIQKVTER